MVAFPAPVPAGDALSFEQLATTHSPPIINSASIDITLIQAYIDSIASIDLFDSSDMLIPLG
jgi:hypothetical protein